jgi:RND family efflux transporter MFP subunit
MYGKKILPLLVIVTGITVLSCAQKEQVQAKSMEQIYSESGKPVEVRTVQPQPFSVYLEYPADFRARTQSTVYAKLDDVVREIDVQVGQKVKRDQIVIGFSRDNSNYQQAKVSYENAKSTYDRMQALFKANGVSKQDFDNARTQYELSRESFRAVSETVYVKSPIDGFITQLNVQTSSNVKPGDALFTVSNQDGFEAYFYVMPDEIGDICPGEKAIATGYGDSIEGRITEVSLNMDPVRKAFLVKAFFAGKPEKLVSGMNVDISVEVYKNDAAVVLNQSNLINDGSDIAAYVVDDGKAVEKKVTIGRSQGLDYEIIDGIEKGDQLITTGSQNLYNGEKVSIITSALAKAAQNEEVSAQ